MADLLLKGISKKFGYTRVIDGIDLHIQTGEFVVIVGPSGCGKSTLLRMIAGLEEADEGDLYIKGRRANDLPPSKRGVAMVFQSYALYPHMTLFDNMAFGLKLKHKGKNNKERIREKVFNTAEILGISDLLDRKPKEISGGQRQGVAIGRAIVREPDIFLFDEPLSNLGASLRVRTRIELAQLHRELKTTIVYVTHDQTEAMTMADRIALLSDGKILQYGTPGELYHKPVNMTVASFIGSPPMNFIRCEVEGGRVTGRSLRASGESVFDLPLIAGHQETRESITLGIRPENIIINDHSDINLTGRVLAVEYLGSDCLIHIELSGGKERLTARSTVETELRRGDEIRIGIYLKQCSFFDVNGRAIY